MNRTVACLCIILTGALVSACSQPDVVLGSGGGGATARPVSGGDEPPADDPYLTGKIVSIATAEPVTDNCVDPADVDADGDGTVSSNDPPACNPDPDVFGSIHIKGTPGAGGEPEAVATVADDVPLVRKTGGGAYEPVAFGDLAEGDVVSLWITGEVLESFPVQVRATFIVVEQ